MYIRVSERRIINAKQITDIEDLPPQDAEEERALVVTFIGGRTLPLGAGEAEAFLRALPVYEPVEEE